MGDLGLSIAASGLDAQQAVMDTISQNLANASTTGYVAENANITTLPGGDSLGIGAGAHGKLTDGGRVTRTVREREPRRYLARGCGAPPAVQVVPEADLPFEFMMNALRLVGGFDPAWFESRTRLPWAMVGAPLARLAERGLLQEEAGRWRPSERGLRFLNDVIAEFLPAPRRVAGARKNRDEPVV
jgi:coproporphyrinogen III oxidase-like Fe-S oxidoreductase